MGVYLTTCVDIRERNTKNIFYKDNDFWCIYKKSKKLKYSSDPVVIAKYCKENNIFEFEIFLDENVDEFYKYFEQYCLDNDITVGVLKKIDGVFVEPLPRVTKKKKVQKKDIVIEPEGSFGCDVASAPKQLNEDLVLDMSFHELLFKYMRECGKDNADIYKDGGITRQVFSKILCDQNMIPSKNTIFCLIIGMRLSYVDAKKLLLSAGYAFSNSILLDKIIAKYIKQGTYNLLLINGELEERKCAQIGWKPRED